MTALRRWEAPALPEADDELGGRAQAVVPAVVMMAMEAQLGEFWCWCAASQAVALSHGHHPAQCDIASRAWATAGKVGRDGCCAGDPRRGPCDHPHHLDTALREVGRLNRKLPSSVEERVVRAELEGGRPVGVRIGWRGGGGHFIVLGGITAGPRAQVLVYDSLDRPPPSWIPGQWRPLRTVEQGYKGTGRWTHTFLTS